MADCHKYQFPFPWSRRGVCKVVALAVIEGDMDLSIHNLDLALLGKLALSFVAMGHQGFCPHLVNRRGIFEFATLVVPDAAVGYAIHSDLVLMERLALPFVAVGHHHVHHRSGSRPVSSELAALVVVDAAVGAMRSLGLILMEMLSGVPRCPFAAAEASIS